MSLGAEAPGPLVGAALPLATSPRPRHGACGGTESRPKATLGEAAAPSVEASTPTVPATTAPPTTLAPTTTSTSTTAVPPTTSTTTTTTTSVLPDAPTVIEANGPVTYGIRDGEILFTVTHDPVVFANVEMTREPNGVLTSLGWHSYLWHVYEFVAAGEDFPGDYLQVEIHRLWPADEAIDVLWLTDYSGATRDTSTGFPVSGPPPQGGSFTLFDAVVLEGQLDRFGLHNDCRIAGDDIGAALFSFEGDTPVPLIAWVVDGDKRAFVEVPDPAAVDLGDCLPPEPRN